MNSHPTTILDKIRVVQGVIRHAESKSGVYFKLSLLLQEVLLILCRNLWQLNRFLKHVLSFVKTRQPDFAELRPFCKTIGNAINFRLFFKKRIKKNWQLFGELNRNQNFFWNNQLASLLLSQRIHCGNVMLSGHNFKLGNQLYIVSIRLICLGGPQPLWSLYM